MENNKNRNVKQRTTKRRKKNNAIIKAVDRLTSDDFTRLPERRALDFRTSNPRSSLPLLRAYHREVKNQYLMGLVHPDIAVKDGINVKLPSDIPIPSASIGFHEQHQFTTSTAGTFLLSWRPCFLFTAGDITNIPNGNAAGQMTYNNSSSLNGTASVAGNAFIATGVYPGISIQRYRLVSALLKMSYNGSVLNQAGTFLGCATFDPLPIATGTTVTSISNYSDGLVDRFGNFSLIQNGLWNTTANITKDSEGLEFLYVPTDPDDYTFQRAGSYYGTSVTTGGTFNPDAEGAHINYIVAGRNLPAAASCIIVDVYYNYEVIADPVSAYILRAQPDFIYSMKDKDEMKDNFAELVKKGGLIRKSSSFDWTDVLKQVAAMGIKYVSTLF